MELACTNSRKHMCGCSAMQAMHTVRSGTRQYHRCWGVFSSPFDECTGAKCYA
jgi:hypothetical protein